MNAAAPSSGGSTLSAPDPEVLRARAEDTASLLPPLLADAQHLANAVLLGGHGRRRAGTGDDFWQYRPLRQGDSKRWIDHRRSARGDQAYVRERESQIAQSVHLWVDQGQSMQYASAERLPTKVDRARLLGLAVSVLMLRAGERVGLTGGILPPRRGKAQLLRLAQFLSEDDASAYAPPEHRALVPQSQAVFISDFLGETEELNTALTKAADRGVRGVLLQVLDPSEEEFPFTGRTRFEAVSGHLSHETLKAAGLRDRYLQRLAERRDLLTDLCREAGWSFGIHHSGDTALSGLLWLYNALERRI